MWRSVSGARCNTLSVLDALWCCDADPGPSCLESSGVPGLRRIARALHRVRDTCLAALFVLALLHPGAARAQVPDTIFFNGKLVRFDALAAQALAVRDGRIAAIGGSDEIRSLAGPSTRVIDLGGRTLIPGLIDSHIHAIRA